MLARPTVRPLALPRLRTIKQGPPFLSYMAGSRISLSVIAPRRLRRRPPGYSKLWAPAFLGLGLIMSLSEPGVNLEPRSITLPVKVLESILEASIPMTATPWVYCSVPALTVMGGEKMTWPKTRLCSIAQCVGSSWRKAARAPGQPYARS